jgi:hypothetical protein
VTRARRGPGRSTGAAACTRLAGSAPAVPLQGGTRRKQPCLVCAVPERLSELESCPRAVLSLIWWPRTRRPHLHRGSVVSATTPAGPDQAAAPLPAEPTSPLAAELQHVAADRSRNRVTAATVLAPGLRPSADPPPSIAGIERALARADHAAVPDPDDGTPPGNAGPAPHRVHPSPARAHRARAHRPPGRAPLRVESCGRL